MNQKPLQDLETMRSVDIRTAERAEYMDIRDTNIDADLPFIEMILDYFQQIGNAYCFNCGDVLVKVAHNPNGKQMNTCMEGFFRSL